MINIMMVFKVIIFSAGGTFLAHSLFQSSTAGIVGGLVGLFLSFKF